MNYAVVKWLLAHRDQLTQVIAIAKNYRDTLPLLEQWAILDKIARIVLPVLQDETKNSLAPVAALMYGDEDEDSCVAAYASDVNLLSVGAECGALGFDWQVIIKVVLPLIISILQSLQSASDQ
jgi:hypothetical protein